MPFSKFTFLDVFDPSLHEWNTYEAWEMSYDVACIGEIKDDASEFVQQQHKAKVFRMCVFEGERLKTDIKSEINTVSYKGNCSGVYSFDEISVAELGFEKISCSSGDIYFFFISLC